MQGLIKKECIRPKCPGSLDEARTAVEKYVQYYNSKRLHSAIGYIAPLDMLNGEQEKIHQTRDQKLEMARLLRKQKREMKHK